MSTNSRAVEILREIGDLLDLQGEKFKPEAYRRAARSIESLSEDLQKVAGRGELRSIPGVGDAIQEKLQEFLKTGTIEVLRSASQGGPPGDRGFDAPPRNRSQERPSILDRAGRRGSCRTARRD